MTSLKESLLQFYHRHETKLHLLFFLGGFALDYLAAQDIDHPLVILQQALYMILIVGILSVEHLHEAGHWTLKRGLKLWPYRGLLLHFLLGGNLNVYAFFFLKSASIFNSIVFVVFLLILIVLNEMPRIRETGLNVRWALAVLCLLCFYTVLFPLLLGFVGWFPFLLAAVATGLSLYVHFRWMMGREKNLKVLSNQFLWPGLAVVAVFVGLYFARLIPPVPLALESSGIYHNLERRDGLYLLSHQRPWWKFWHRGDQQFLARPGDSIYFFTQVFSPARFSDEVLIHWLYQDPRQGWMSSDKVRMSISGGRKEGFRGYSVKKNYQPGSWRVQVETTDGREIGRLYFTVETDSADTQRDWQIDPF